MDEKQNNIKTENDDDDMRVETALASFYTSKLKNETQVKSEDKEFDFTPRTSVALDSSELNKTAIIEKSDDFPATNYHEIEEDDEPYQPENISYKKVVKKRESTRNARLKEEQKRKIKNKQSRRTFAHIFGSILLLVFIISVSSFFSYYVVRSALDFTGIVRNEFEVEVEIPENATTEEIAQILKSNGIIDMPELFVFFSRISNADGNYLNGLFSLDSTMSYSNLISSLQKVNRVSETVTVRIQEGMTSVEIGQLLEENLVCKASDFEYYYKNKQNNYNFEKRVLLNSKKFYQLEGYLFPDTYEFYIVDEMTTDEDVDTSVYAEIAAKKIFSNFNSKITKEMYKKINEMGFTLDEFMTLASMVQAEAGTVEDMMLVASVFLNRLNNNDLFPKLQSDVTILYAENIIKPHVSLKNESIYMPIIKAYNTYESDGLPPGPICNPGMDAIEAVLNAPASDYYYFCANEETLEMYYASTVSQHELNLVTAGLA